MTKMAKNKVTFTSHSLSGCNTDEMAILAKSLCLRKPSALVIHCGTNDLYPRSGNDTKNSANLAKSENQIAAKLKDIAEDLQKDHPGMKILVSKLVRRDDKGGEGVNKVNNVNSLLSKTNLNLIENRNITSKMLNGSNLHLKTDSGVVQLARNIVNHVKNVF